jgi:NADH-quinone oxidoreductase subunit J
VEDLNRILFWVFSSLMLGSGALAITRAHLVNAAMFFIQVILCMAGLFLLLDAQFLALIQVLVYAGSVVVLFLFVIMLLDQQAEPKRVTTSGLIAGGITFASLTALVGTIVLQHQRVNPETTFVPLAGSVGLRDVIRTLFTHYLLPFELTALVLLTAMVGIVVLSRKR